MKGAETPDLEVHTLGCRLNAFESEVMRVHARAAGLADTVIVHSCAVTAEAERQTRQAIRRARRGRPEARIVVTGCSVQVDPERYRAMPEIDHLLGNEDKLRPEVWQGLASGGGVARALVSDVMEVRRTAPHLVGGFDGRTRAYLQVQQGCDHRCTFCIIPMGRGPSRSVAPEAIVAQARLLVDNGYRELVVTGVDITSWGKDLLPARTLGSMLAEVLREVPDLPRLRLSSIDPAEVDADLLRLVAEEPRLMPHLHLSVQAGDDLILKRMKRRHARRDVLALCARLRSLRPDMVFGADLIAGFPTESEAMASRGEELVEEADIALLHVFPYSERPGTPAARMPAVPREVRRERAARLRKAGGVVLDRLLARERGETRSVLVEEGERGRTEHFLPVQLRHLSARQAPGGIVDMRFRGVQERVLLAAPDEATASAGDLRAEAAA